LFEKKIKYKTRNIITCTSVSLYIIIMVYNKRGHWTTWHWVRFLFLRKTHLQFADVLNRYRVREEWQKIHCYVWSEGWLSNFKPIYILYPYLCVRVYVYTVQKGMKYNTQKSLITKYICCGNYRLEEFNHNNQTAILSILKSIYVNFSKSFFIQLYGKIVH